MDGPALDAAPVGQHAPGGALVRPSSDDADVERVLLAVARRSVDAVSFVTDCSSHVEKVPRVGPFPTGRLGRTVRGRDEH